MSAPERMKAIRRLFLAKLEKMPAEMPYERRQECARKELDRALGPMWREEVAASGEELDPTGNMFERLDRVQEATREEGFHSDDVVKPSQGIIKKLMAFFHGRK